MTRPTWFLVAALAVGLVAVTARCSTGLRADPPVYRID